MQEQNFLTPQGDVKLVHNGSFAGDVLLSFLRLWEAAVTATPSIYYESKKKKKNPK